MSVWHDHLACDPSVWQATTQVLAESAIQSVLTLTIHYTLSTVVKLNQ